MTKRIYDILYNYIKKNQKGVRKKMKLPEMKCNRCGYTWVARIVKPRMCPSCKSFYWNRPRKNKPGAGRPKRKVVKSNDKQGDNKKEREES